MVSAKTRWSAYVAIYAFVVGAGLLVPLGVVAETITKVLGVGTESTGIVVPGSGALIGGIIWWAIVERREAYTFLAGGAAGLVTGGLTVSVWALAGALLYGPGAILVVGPVILFVLGVVSPIACIGLLPMMYARRQLGGGESQGDRLAIA